MNLPSNLQRSHLSETLLSGVKPNASKKPPSKPGEAKTFMGRKE
jgi:hypothetical protein